MSISYNTGTTATADYAASVAVTIPSGVLPGDVMLMALEVFTEDSSAPTISFSGAGGGWTLIPMTDASANPQSAGTNPYGYGYAYYRVATSGDPGATLTITETGSSAGTTWIDVALASYTGASTTAPIDVAGSAAAYDAGTTGVTFPTLSTTNAGDWAAFLVAGAPGVGCAISGPSGSTERQTVTDGTGIGAALLDSNGTTGVGSIGGGHATSTNASATWWSAFTIGLAPSGSGGGSVTGTGAVTLPTMKLAGAGYTPVTGTGGVTLPAMKLAGAGGLDIASGGVTLPKMIVGAVGTVQTPASSLTLPVGSAIPGALAAFMALATATLPSGSTVWFGEELPTYSAPVTLQITEIQGDQNPAEMGGRYRREETFSLICLLSMYQGGAQDFPTIFGNVMAQFNALALAVGNNPSLIAYTAEPGVQPVRYAQVGSFIVTPNSDQNGQSAVTLSFALRCAQRVESLSGS